MSDSRPKLTLNWNAVHSLCICPLSNHFEFFTQSKMRQEYDIDTAVLCSA